MAVTIDCNTNMYVSPLGGLTESCIGGGLGLADDPCGFSASCFAHHCALGAVEYSFLIPGPLSDLATCDCSEHVGTWILNRRTFIGQVGCYWRYDTTSPSCNYCASPTHSSFQLRMLPNDPDPGDTKVQATAWGQGTGGCSSIATWNYSFSSSETLDCVGSFTLPLIASNNCSGWPNPLTVTAI